MADSSLIHVVFISDEGFALPTGVAIASLLSARDPATEYAVHIISSGLSADSESRLRSLAGAGASIDIREVNGAEFAEITSNNVHVSSAAIFKFKLPEIFSELDRILYLDGDIVVRGDLTELWRTDLSNAYVAAVEDTQARKFGGKTLQERIGYPYERYFNSGVMLVNLSAWRRDGMTAKLLDYRLNGRNDFMDQDALNWVLGGRTEFLDARFNTLATNIRYEEESVRQAKEQAAVIYHYASPEKPWKQEDVDNAALWQTAFAASPFADVRLELKPRSELDTYKRRSHALWAQLERATRDREAAREKLKSVTEESQAHQAKAAERLKSIVWLKERLASAEAQREESGRAAAQAAADLQEYKQRADRIWIQRTKLMADVETLKGSLKAAQDQAERTAKEAAAAQLQAETRLGELRDELLKLSAEKATLEAALADARARGEKLQGDLKAGLARISELDAKRDELSADLCSVRREAAESAAELASLKASRWYRLGSRLGFIKGKKEGVES